MNPQPPSQAGLPRSELATPEYRRHSWYLFRSGELTLASFVVALAAVSSLLYFHHFRDFYNNDSPTYITPAANLVVGRGFTDANGHPEIARTPGYPLLILPFVWAKVNLKYLIILQHVLRVLITLLTAIFVLRISRSRLEGYVAGCFLAIDLPFLEAANLVMPEILFTLLLLPVLWLLWKDSFQPEGHWTRCMVSGALAGASVLIRPVSLFFFVPSALYLVIVCHRFRFRAALIFSVAFMLCPVLWTSRNYRETSYFGISTIGAKNLLLYRAAGALAVLDPGDFRTNFFEQQSMLEHQACEELAKIYDEPCSRVTAAQQAEYYSREGRRIVLKHPFAYAKLTSRAITVTMLDGGAFSLADMTGITAKTTIRILLVYTVPAFCFALIGLKRLRKENRQLFYLLFFTIAYFVVISAGAEAYSRFRVPVEPAYAVLIAQGVACVKDYFRRANAREPQGTM